MRTARAKAAQTHIRDELVRLAEVWEDLAAQRQGILDKRRELGIGK